VLEDPLRGVDPDEAEMGLPQPVFPPPPEGVSEKPAGDPLVVLWLHSRRRGEVEVQHRGGEPAEIGFLVHSADFPPKVVRLVF